MGFDGAIGGADFQDFNLDAAQKANLVALPLLGGFYSTLVLGYLTDKIGPRKTGIVGFLLTFVPLIIGWKLASSLNDMYLVGLMLGMPAPASQPRCRLRAAGTRQNIKGLQWASPAPATAVRSTHPVCQPSRSALW